MRSPVEWTQPVAGDAGSTGGKANSQDRLLIQVNTGRVLLGRGLVVMAALAQRLPVVYVPEPAQVAFVRHDVVFHGSGHHPACSGALTAQWFVTKEQPPGLLPAGCVATTVGTGPIAGALPWFWLVPVTVAIEIGGGFRAPGLAAGFRDSAGHKKTLVD